MFIRQIVQMHLFVLTPKIYFTTPLFLFTESAHWKNSVSKSQCSSVVCVSPVPLGAFLKNLITPISKCGNSNPLIAKRKTYFNKTSSTMGLFLFAFLFTHTNWLQGEQICS